MILELDDDFTDEITVTNLAQSYVSISSMMKNGNDWHEDDVAAWKELLPALMTVGKWYSVDFNAELKKAKKGKK
jgi:chloramphenicol 3-O-phosphotransferase